MNGRTLVAVVLLVGGILALIYGGFTYTSETHDAKIGPLELSVKDRERVNIPLWAGALVALTGGALLALKNKPA